MDDVQLGRLLGAMEGIPPALDRLNERLDKMEREKREDHGILHGKIDKVNDRVNMTNVKVASITGGLIAAWEFAKHAFGGGHQ